MPLNFSGGNSGWVGNLGRGRFSNVMRWARVGRIESELPGCSNGAGISQPKEADLFDGGLFYFRIFQGPTEDSQHFRGLHRLTIFHLADCANRQSQGGS
jgi:hypothetical protein